jgi:hypothetical protein
MFRFGKNAKNKKQDTGKPCNCSECPKTHTHNIRGAVLTGEKSKPGKREAWKDEIDKILKADTSLHIPSTHPQGSAWYEKYGGDWGRYYNGDGSRRTFK